MNQIYDLFDRMDAWRRRPGYQLERRAEWASTNAGAAPVRSP